MPDSAPLRIAILTSSSAAGVERLLADPNRGALYDVACVVSTETDLLETPLLDAAKVPVILRPLRRELGSHGLSLRNLHAREDYDRETADLLKSLQADWVILDGYHYIVTEPLLDIYPNRVLCIHEGDLTQVDEYGHRKFVEMHAVRRAIFGGERETRSSMYFATPHVGEGPLFLLSEPFPVSPIASDGLKWGAYDLVNSYARTHREWMLRASWGPMIERAIQFVAAGTIRVANDIAWIDGVPGPCRLGEAPRECHLHVNEIARGIPSSCPFIES